MAPPAHSPSIFVPISDTDGFIGNDWIWFAIVNSVGNPMSFWKDIRRVTIDCAGLGPGILLRYPAKLMKTPTVRLPLKGLGRVLIRPGDTDFGTFSQVFVGGHYDIARFPQQAKIDKRYRDAIGQGKIPVVIDAGANVGATSIWFARMFPAAQIIGIEPDPQTALILAENIKPYPNIRVIVAAVGSEPGRVSLRAQRNEAWSVRTQRDAGGEVEVVTINSLLDREDELVVVKVDIEGFESDLFAANLEWIDRASAIFLELHDWLLPNAGTSYTAQAALCGRGFEMLVFGETLCFVR